MDTCREDHEGQLPGDFRKLPASQRGAWRHVCAGCAYLLGKRHGAEAEERLRERVRALTAQVKALECGRGAER
jgi:hypothetical protein